MDEHGQRVEQEGNTKQTLSADSLNMLSQEQIRLIDDALSELGPFGEVRLIKAKGKLRFIQVLESRSAL